MSIGAPVRSTTQCRGMRLLQVSGGNFLEMFDFFLFVFHASHIANAYFPAGIDFACLRLTFMTFGAGMIFGAGFLVRLAFWTTRRRPVCGWLSREHAGWWRRS
jgi:hypothetical protein